ncbi:hypothetical protein O181_070216 [Austropuccinia psidii MF-1]|uniref:Uncharacterized protein n=1 Tax=Austropuccinia psidii MF-1 TaxID=1389203 RepID=A0A9Q3I5H1_9BASI|nr:hypothetical protein [Austropuccinia psidii MF-1]
MPAEYAISNPQLVAGAWATFPACPRLKIIHTSPLLAIGVSFAKTSGRSAGIQHFFRKLITDHQEKLSNQSSGTATTSSRFGALLWPVAARWVPAFGLGM